MYGSNGGHAKKPSPMAGPLPEKVNARRTRAGGVLSGALAGVTKAKGLDSMLAGSARSRRCRRGYAPKPDG